MISIWQLKTALKARALEALESLTTRRSRAPIKTVTKYNIKDLIGAEDKSND